MIYYRKDRVQPEPEDGPENAEAHHHQGEGRRPMTPARLEEVGQALGSEHPPSQRALMGIAHELLDEVRRLREALTKIRDQECDCWCVEECDCQYVLRGIAEQALDAKQ